MGHLIAGVISQGNLMRALGNCSKKEQKALLDKFDTLLDVVKEHESGEYEQSSISFFDHWLSRDEAIKHLDNVSLNKQVRRDTLLHEFCSKLASETEVKFVKFRGRYRNKPVFKNIKSNRALYPEPYNIGERWRFVLVLPELNAVYCEGCDFTHHIYYPKFQDLSLIYKVANQCGVHVI